MSIYATLWNLQFPRDGQYVLGCEWIGVCAQGVPGHIGTPTEGYGYESDDPFASFLPPPITLESENDDRLRAVVIVTSETKKGTAENGQEYVDPLLVFTGEEYERLRFDELYHRICTELGRGKPRVVSQKPLGDGRIRNRYSDGSTKVVRLDAVE